MPNEQRTTLEYRIQMVGDWLMNNPVGKRVGLCVDDLPGNPEKYKTKLGISYPDVYVEWEGRDPELPGIYVMRLMRRSRADRSAPGGKNAEVQGK